LKIGVAATHREHPSKSGGIRRRLTSAVHDDLESVSTITGIRSRQMKFVIFRTESRLGLVEGNCILDLAHAARTSVARQAVVRNFSIRLVPG